MSADLIIGIDESGKGDFFGPLVIAGFLSGRKDSGRLAALDVRDSKKISDGVVVTLAARLRDEFPHFVLVITPTEYNRRYEKIKNLNILLAEGHAEVISQMVGRHKADLAISDKFGKAERLESAMAARKCTITLKQMVRGEAVPQVAAASIIARAGFIEEMKRLGERFGVDLPKGAAPQVDLAGRAIIASHGIEILRDLSKLHFKNYQRVITV